MSYFSDFAQCLAVVVAWGSTASQSPITSCLSVTDRLRRIITVNLSLQNHSHFLPFGNYKHSQCIQARLDVFLNVLMRAIDEYATDRRYLGSVMNRAKLSLHRNVIPYLTRCPPKGEQLVGLSYKC